MVNIEIICKQGQKVCLENLLQIGEFENPVNLPGSNSPLPVPLRSMGREQERHDGEEESCL